MALPLSLEGVSGLGLNRKPHILWVRIEVMGSEALKGCSAARVVKVREKDERIESNG
jgi:hypothetical protein